MDIGNLLQNRNFVMFIITFAFIVGVMSFYNGAEVIFAGCITFFMLLLFRLRFINLKPAILVVVMFYLGFFNAALRIKTFDELSLLAPTDISVEGQVVTIPETSGNVSKFYLKEKRGKVLVWLSDKEHTHSIKIGNRYQISGHLRRPPEVSNPSQFDYARFLQNHDAYSILYANTENCTELHEKLSPKWKFIQTLNNLRKKILTVHQRYLKSPNLEILGGIVFGDDAVAPPEHIKSSFINSGLLHILAASGMNVAFIWGFWFFFMRKLKIDYRITLISGIVLIILYTLMTGLGASVVRAGLMLIFVLLGKLFDRDAHSVSLLSFVALLMLIYNPAYLNDIGFQMSFLATLGILLMGQPIQERLQNVKLPEFIKGDTTIPIVAQSWVAPTQMFYFNTFAPFSVLANIAIIPFLCIISFGGFLSSILAIFYPFTKYLCLAMDFVINLFITIIVNISNFFASLPNSLIITQKPCLFAIIIYYTLLCLITVLIKNGINRKILLTCVILTIIVSLSFIKIPNRSLEIIAFDVQNADCFLIKTPDNDYYIIDTGKFSYTSKNPQAAMIIGKYLKDNGIHKIKGLIITHFDNDHAGGGAYLIENFNVEKVYLSTQEHNTITASAVFNALDITGTPFEVGQNGELLKNTNTKIKLMISGLKESDNENSLQSLITYGDFDALFTGDAGTKAFEKIKNEIPHEIDYLKVGHHGAKNTTSSQMLEKLTPKLAIISTGANRFGHPSKQTLENLHLAHVKYYRTDYEHAVKVKTDGKTIKIYTYQTKGRKFIQRETIDAD